MPKLLLTRAFAIVLSGLSILGGAHAAPGEDPLTRAIPANPTWLTPQAPLRLHGTSYYVGTGGLSVVLIDTADGLILVDAALPQTVSTVEGNIRALGFRVEDIRYILSTEAHHDHAGGLAAIARDSGAVVITSPLAAEALAKGQAPAEDPQTPNLEAFPAVSRIKPLNDGETLRLGTVTVTAVFTPGHTPGSVSWTWRSCERDDCKTIVFASSLNAVGSRAFRFTDQPNLVATFRRSFGRVAALDCDILISAHPDNSGLNIKLAAVETSRSPNPLIDDGACRTYADRAAGRLDAQLAREASAPKKD